MRSYIMEILGTFFLVLAIGFTGNEIAVGLILSAMIYAGAHVSGAHYNPAVSLAFFLKRKLSFKKLLAYTGSQLLGAFLACALVYSFSSMVFYVEPPVSSNLYQQAGTEILLTFVFVYLMLAFALSPKLKGNKIYGFAIGLTFAGITLAGTNVSGGIYNPATSIGSAAFDFILGGNSYQYALLYTLAPLCGGALAAAAFTYFEK